MTLSLLLDTHIVARWLVEPQKLSVEQRRVIRNAVHRRETPAISAITLIEVAVLGEPGSRRRINSERILKELDSNSDFHILPLTVEIAAEVAAIGRSLRDPVDRVIVATARIHGLRLVTADQRIIDSKLVPVVV